jgi:tetratricopeptide (TPR) repeat protein
MARTDAKLFLCLFLPFFTNIAFCENYSIENTLVDVSEENKLAYSRIQDCIISADKERFEKEVASVGPRIDEPELATLVAAGLANFGLTDKAIALSEKTMANSNFSMGSANTRIVLLSNLAVFYYHNELYRGAISASNAALDLIDKYQRDNRILRRDVLLNLARSYRDSDSIEDAMSSYESCISCLDKQNDFDSTVRAQVLYEAALLKKKLGMYLDSLTYFEQTVPVFISVFGSNGKSRQMYNLYYNCGYCSFMASKYASAQDYLLEAKNIISAIEPFSHEFADTAFYLAISSFLEMHKTGVKDSAIASSCRSLLAESQSLYLDIDGEASEEYIRGLLDLGLLSDYMGNCKDSVHVFEQCLELSLARYGYNSIVTSLVYISLAEEYDRVGEPEKASLMRDHGDSRLQYLSLKEKLAALYS